MSNPFTEEWLAERTRVLRKDLGISQFSAEFIAEEERGVMMLESEIEAECTKLLQEDGWRALRTDPVSDRSRGKGFGELGMADHQYLRYYPSPFNPLCDKPLWAAPAQVMWIEFKRPGEKAKTHQQLWHQKERARGALTLIAGEDFPATVEGFKAWYASSGLRRVK